MNDREGSPCEQVENEPSDNESSHGVCLCESWEASDAGGEGLMVGPCFACTRRKELTSEHIVPHALGGRLKGLLYCKECNDRFGKEIDAEISKQFGKIATLLNIKRERGGETRPFDVREISTGTELVFDGKGFTRKGVIVNLSSKDGKKLDAADITVRSKGELKKTCAEIRKRYEVSGEMKEFQEHHPGPTDAVHETEINSRLLRRASAKIAYSFLCTKVSRDIVLSSAFDGIRAYIKDDEGPDLSCANYVHTRFMTDHVRPLHKVHVALNRDDKIVVGYVSLFGMYRFTVVLSDDFVSDLEWADLDYTFDPVRLQEVFMLGNERLRGSHITRADILNPKQSKELVEAEISRGHEVVATYVDGYEFLHGEVE